MPRCRAPLCPPRQPRCTRGCCLLPPAAAVRETANGYDGLLHLSSESRTGANGYTALYVVDGVSNRMSSTVGGVTTTYTYDNDDELTSTSGGFVNSYGYNANGDQTTRTLSGTSYSLTYDYDDQLTSTGGSGFAYDAAGRRASRTAGGVTTSFLYDGGSVLLEKQGGTTSATYTYGNALIRKGGETPLFDGLGSERTVTNSGQAVTASLTLSAFGQTIASSGGSTSAYGFGATSGYRTEGDVGLTLVGCRFYDAQVGRFITRDTYLDQAPYAYCDGDPVNYVDPDGHAGSILDGIGKAIGGIVGGIKGIVGKLFPIKIKIHHDDGSDDETYDKDPSKFKKYPPPPGGSKGGSDTERGGVHWRKSHHGASNDVTITFGH